MALKAYLRKEYLARRKRLSAEELAQQSQQIADLFFAHYAPTQGGSVHTFLPIKKHHELDTWLIVRKLWAEFPQTQVVVPVANPVDFSMTHFHLNPDTGLQENRWGIPEPVNSLPVPESEMTTVLVPLLCFDQQGHRVGYGKGFYDRFLALIPASSQKIGLSLTPPVDVIDDAEASDFTLDAVITPEKIYTFS
ncbi:5-formyltetrahydrofolate cyclo-ligase [Rufibacter sp. LB8]|uniref:5-formyltetrahydrofolate cyclo-ligase n=1 Tax=Rufibacter sp. LB8 TaxID=2777781 RepID=UPI00178C75A7|nr:5-formyltetrahydrofolate cyclo-ligase [Rufibacter sp. LB8]